MKLKIPSKILIGLYLITSLFWIVLVIIAKSAAVAEQTLYTLRLYTQWPLVFIPLVGGLLGIKNSRHWGGVKSIMGRSSFFLSIGLMAWAGGMVFWNYYIFFTDIEIPYPSLADVGFVLGLLFLVCGIVYLSKAIGVRFALRNKKGKALLFIIPIVVILISIYLLVIVARGGSIAYDDSFLKLFFDLLYPLGDVLILAVISLVYLLSREYLGGVYKGPILVLLVGFLLFYFSDFLFSYTTTQETYFNGHFVDFLFTTTMFILSLGLSMLDSRRLAKDEQSA